MKLYSWQVAPNPRRVRLFVAEKGIPLDVIEVGELGSSKLSDDYLGKYPHRVVPALELDDGTVIGEAPVICRYLEALYPEIPLLGSGLKSRR